MATEKPSKATSGKYSDLGRDGQKLVEQRFTALAEINRQRAKAVETHFELVRRGIIDLRDGPACW
jgi:hypothetical protein